MTLASNSPAFAKAPLHKSSDSAQMKIAQQHLLSNHGIECQKSIFNELRCSTHRYPHCDECMSDIFPVSEVTRHLRQYEGIYITLLDYRTTNSNSDASNIVHIRWTEVPFIQIWSTYFRGDYRPPIVINGKRGTAKFGNDFLSIFEQFDDDNLRLTELLLAFERKKNDQQLKTI
jgi:hypothetical protein